MMPAASNIPALVPRRQCYRNLLDEVDLFDDEVDLFDKVEKSMKSMNLNGSTLILTPRRRCYHDAYGAGSVFGDGAN